MQGRQEQQEVNNGDVEDEVLKKLEIFTGRNGTIFGAPSLPAENSSCPEKSDPHGRNLFCSTESLVRITRSG
jgi:hypothetical protein